ncbi:hypothetical protein [Candidatus Epulonipiscium viviparus]|uniref:hypothetical protein n=1 Tax=Candidatus Epulonipiscium viviparus TaxID=420336 RepID=UPI00273808BE|nr:hypothetical protein [Candidatus Epulopiscium viviparus]
MNILEMLKEQDAVSDATAEELWVQAIAEVCDTTYAKEAIQKQMDRGEPLAEILCQYLGFLNIVLDTTSQQVGRVASEIAQAWGYKETGRKDLSDTETLIKSAAVYSR